jgi:deoxyribodipyrimidine photo-lyase
MKKSLFLFRRDFRIDDNTALLQALTESDVVILAFIFNPEQLNGEYKSDTAIQFMVSSLKELDAETRQKGAKLYFFEGTPVKIIKKIILSEKVNAVYVNEDYTPFSKKRDLEIGNLCKELGSEFYSFPDALLNSPGKVLKSDGSFYSKFTPFFNVAKKFDVLTPNKISKKEFSKLYSKKIALSDSSLLDTHSLKLKNNLKLKGGRKEALGLLHNLGKYKGYSTERDYPELSSTTLLSAHLKFGTISVREAYWAIRKELGGFHELLKQLYWRDFFYHIASFNPEVFGHAFMKKFDSLKWENNKEYFKAWCEGKTGFPIIDAGMRELNETGYMHNRVRMIVSSFLVKDIHIDWRLGEKYFAQKLIDYDPCVNNGNWQWAASTGCDSQPYFRIFNPWLQQKKFDPDCKYIKKWVPELRELSAFSIHNLAHKGTLLSKGYPEQIVDHQLEKVKTINYFKNAK